jgi:hypothetical protein
MIRITKTVEEFNSNFQKKFINCKEKKDEDYPEEWTDKNGNKKKEITDDQTFEKVLPNKSKPEVAQDLWFNLGTSLQLGNVSNQKIQDVLIKDEITSEIGKLQNKYEELQNKYEEAQKKNEVFEKWFKNTLPVEERQKLINLFK